MLNIVKYVVNTKGNGQKINPVFKKNEPWDLIFQSNIMLENSNYVSKAQWNVTLSSSETE